MSVFTAATELRAAIVAAKLEPPTRPPVTFSRFIRRARALHDEVYPLDVETPTYANLGAVILELVRLAARIDFTPEGPSTERWSYYDGSDQADRFPTLVDFYTPVMPRPVPLEYVELVRVTSEEFQDVVVDITNAHLANSAVGTCARLNWFAHHPSKIPTSFVSNEDGDAARDERAGALPADATRAPFSPDSFPPLVSFTHIGDLDDVARLMRGVLGAFEQPKDETLISVWMFLHGPNEEKIKACVRAIIQLTDAFRHGIRYVPTPRVIVDEWHRLTTSSLCARCGRERAYMRYVAQGLPADLARWWVAEF